MEFGKLLKSIQKQLKIDREIYKETGCKSELLIRIDNFSGGGK